ncbi:MULTISPECIES: universal stress protein [Pseudonocardia]|uniref:Universal stress protein n=2 Tax=Pseudonocardia TaxID=1847 RepID=A0A1Y2N6L9_PSEAH|nr:MULTISPECIES: universal stress protein [Pseudonocardia]OSY42747.1 Universal stress protein [Pseudonocardia autotrophica]TDN77324.1 nucleotide-binding universal stress UspA family protein [Pseudonocardia autotrophica]BBG01346.1 universal stress protein [Pseudonocardia autotrophica]GEC24402.1 universal stress protein [Pseudonocardia saturnea]
MTVDGQEVPAVVVGVDGSESALGAVRWAAGEAMRRGAPLRLVGVLEWSAYRPPAAAGVLPDGDRDVLLEHLRKELTGAAAQAHALAPDLTVTHDLLVGSPKRALLDEAGAAALLVLGSRGRGGFVGLLTGSVSMALPAAAPCPVVVVRGAGVPDGPVVVGVDGSPEGALALRYAVESAARLGTSVLAVRAWSHDRIDPYVLELVRSDGVEDDERRQLEKSVLPARQARPDVPIETELVRGHPAQALLEAGQRAQLLVVGSRGNGGVTGMLLGSISRSVLHHAHCPVAVLTGPPPSDVSGIQP